MLEEKKILLGVSGGIAAYKSADLVRRLREAGAEVQVVMTASAQQFVSALTFQALSGKTVRESLFDRDAEAAMGHIELARWADAILIAPASANLIARMAHGHADDLLTTLCLATEAPVLLAPAMNRQMWAHPATQNNCRLLAERGVELLGPDTGSQACGEIGAGRMLEPIALVESLAAIFSAKPLHGVKICVTAGPTQEAMDPVRYISNRSSGRMGFALAQAAVEAGAEVSLISGPVSLGTPCGVTRIDIRSALEMKTAVMKIIGRQDIFIGCAAVADYRPLNVSDEKIKKQSTDRLELTLTKNPDILAEVANLPTPPFTLGFAAETGSLLAEARRKLEDKKLSMIAANHVGSAESGFDSDKNALSILWKNGAQEFPLSDKLSLARQLINLLAEHYLINKK